MNFSRAMGLSFNGGSIISSDGSTRTYSNNLKKATGSKNSSRPGKGGRSRGGKVSHDISTDHYDHDEDDDHDFDDDFDDEDDDDEDFDDEVGEDDEDDEDDDNFHRGHRKSGSGSFHGRGGTAAGKGGKWGGTQAGKWTGKNAGNWRGKQNGNWGRGEGKWGGWGEVGN